MDSIYLDHRITKTMKTRLTQPIRSTAVAFLLAYISTTFPRLGTILISSLRKHRDLTKTLQQVRTTRPPPRIRRSTVSGALFVKTTPVPTTSRPRIWGKHFHMSVRHPPPRPQERDGKNQARRPRGPAGEKKQKTGANGTESIRFATRSVMASH